MRVVRMCVLCSFVRRFWREFKERGARRRRAAHIVCARAFSRCARLTLSLDCSINNDPTEGFAVEIVADHIFSWHVYIEGPKDTPYEGGVFKLLMVFPPSYPMQPPTLTFLSKFWHPNVYADGKVCLSILHAPGNDAMSGELPEERCRSQLVSVVVFGATTRLVVDVLLRRVADAECDHCGSLLARFVTVVATQQLIALCVCIVFRCSRCSACWASRIFPVRYANVVCRCRASELSDRPSRRPTLTRECASRLLPIDAPGVAQTHDVCS